MLSSEKYRKTLSINRSQDFPGTKLLEPAPSLEVLGPCCLQGQDCVCLVQGLCICIYDADTTHNNCGSQGNGVQAHAAGVVGWTQTFIFRCSPMPFAQQQHRFAETAHKREVWHMPAGSLPWVRWQLCGACREQWGCPVPAQDWPAHCAASRLQARLLCRACARFHL